MAKYQLIPRNLERFGGVDILVNNVGGSSTPTGGVLGSESPSYIVGAEHAINGGIVRTV